MIKNKKDNQKDNPLIGEVFVDPICDVGFKKIMSNEEILVDFLNTFLPEGTPKIVSATLLSEERLGKSVKSKKIFFDVRAKDNRGKIYIIEVQRKPQYFFVNRSIYYNSREISSQGEVGKLKKYEILPVYSISVLNFVPNVKWSKYYYNVFTYRRKRTFEELTDITAQIFILLPLMKLSSEKVRDRRAKWCYLLRNIVKFNEKTLANLKWTKEDIFEKMKEVLYVSGLTDKEREMLDEAKKIEMDYNALLEESKEDGIKVGLRKGRLIGRKEGRKEGIKEGRKEGIKEGRKEGIKEGFIATAKNMLAEGYDIKTIAKLVKLPESKIKSLKTSMKK